MCKNPNRTLLRKELNRTWTQMSWFLLSSFTEWNYRYIHTFHSERGVLLYLGQPCSNTNLMIINIIYDLCLLSISWYLQLQLIHNTGVLASEGRWEAWQPSPKVTRSQRQSWKTSRWAWGKQVHGMWYYFSLQCFDTVGWATGRASGL